MYNENKKAFLWDAYHLLAPTVPAPIANHQMPTTWGARPDVQWARAGDLHSKVQCIMGNGHMGTPLWTDTSYNVTKYF